MSSVCSPISMSLRLRDGQSLLRVACRDDENVL